MFYFRIFHAAFRVSWIWEGTFRPPSEFFGIAGQRRGGRWVAGVAVPEATDFAHFALREGLERGKMALVGVSDEISAQGLP